MAKERRYRARVDRLTEKVMQRDRDFFARHPSEQSYVRPYVPGEFWPLRPDAASVRVTVLRPGVRFRQPLAYDKQEVT